MTTLTYHGDTGGHAFDGYAGFRIGRSYTLTYTQEFDEVILQIPHAPGRELRVSAADFAKWFRKSPSAWAPEPNVPMTEENTDWGF